MPNMNLPAPLLRAWAAGVFDGKCKISDRRNDLYFDSFDDALLRDFAEITGSGWVRPIKTNGTNLKNQFRWATKSLGDTRNVLLFVLPMLRDTKAAQAATLIKRIEGNKIWQKRQGEPKVTL